MLEVEMKFRLMDWSSLLNTLAAWGATAAPVRKDTDSYFNAPDRDFAQTDEAVRVRRIGLANVLTYKGPKIDSPTKTRTEIELKLADGPGPATDAVRFLSGLGYRPVAVVTKTRTVYRFERHGFPIEVCLDDVGAVGKFVEVEVMATPEQFEAAQRAVMTTATELGLTDQERRSYLRLLLERK
ncbi:MAG: class IV adenylate cyclase [Fimbriiglobus sp.]|jgi:adenylate cyclase class 2|nr:class IV adenylate cyclase [Fimbriiglobus sp.]